MGWWGGSSHEGFAGLRKRWSRHNISIANTAAFAASLKLDSSHIFTAYSRLECSQVWELACLRKRCSRHNISIASTTAFAASLKLDSSHICTAYIGLKCDQMWELACLRRRWFRPSDLYRPCRRLRSLAEARQLPQVTVFILWNAITCGSWLACEGGGSGPTSLSPMPPTSQPR